MASFPIDPWTSSRDELIQAINPETANFTWQGTPALVIAALRAYPSASVVHQLLKYGATPYVTVYGKTLLEFIESSKTLDQGVKAEFAIWTPAVPARPTSSLGRTL